MKYRAALLAAFFCLILSGCGFHLRNSESIPPDLHQLYLQSPNHFSQFHTMLANNLRALHLNLVDNVKQAPITLDIMANTLSHSDPGLVSTNMALPYTFALTTQVALRDPQGQLIAGPATLVSSRVIILNNNQVLNSSIGLSTQEEIIRDNISKLYFWLISGDTQKALAHYANHRSRTKTTH